MRGKSRIIAAILAVVLMLQAAPFGALAEDGATSADSTLGVSTLGLSIGTFALTPMLGSGTEQDPYQISTPEQLDAVRNNLSAHYKLMNDIDLSDAGWVPIGSGLWTGSSYNRFTGVLDGQGYIIRNLKITENRTYNGLFGDINGATIKNVGLEGVDINITTSTSEAYVGGIFGSGTDSIISNCYNTGNVSAASSSTYSYSVYAGGIGGKAWASSISNCYNKGDVSASSSSSDTSYSMSHIYSYAGGICGSGDNSTPISICYNTGNVTAFSHSSATTPSYAYAGGISGFNQSDSVSNCYNRGDISASFSSSSTTLSSSSSYAYAGGISGYAIFGGGATINNCYSISDISASFSYDNTYRYFYAYAGGICGNDSPAGSLSNCYWNSDREQNVNGASVVNKSGVGTGTDITTPLTATQMKQKSSFVGFDFYAIWAIDTYMYGPRYNDGYPFLRVFRDDGNAGDGNESAGDIINGYTDFMNTFSGLTKKGVIDKSGYKDLGNLSWCARFVANTAGDYLGNNLIIPKTNDVKVMKNGILGTEVSVPEKGDVIFFDWSTKVPSEFNIDKAGNRHVGVVFDVDPQMKWIKVVHGNWGNSPSTSTVCGIGHKNEQLWFGEAGCSQVKYSASGNVAGVVKYVRPDYSKIDTLPSGKITMTYKCPIDVSISFEGAILNSASGEFLTNWGTMLVDNANGERQITVVVDYGNTYDIVITGTGTGTMDLELEFDTNDGQNSRSFLNVPITSHTTAHVLTSAAISGVEIIVVDDNDDSATKVWFARPNEAVAVVDDDLTEAFYVQDKSPDPDDVGGGNIKLTPSR